MAFAQCFYPLKILRSVFAAKRNPERRLYYVTQSLGGCSKMGQITANQGAAFLDDVPGQVLSQLSLC